MECLAHDLAQRMGERGRGQAELGGQHGGVAHRGGQHLVAHPTGAGEDQGLDPAAIDELALADFRVRSLCWAPVTVNSVCTRIRVSIWELGGLGSSAI